MMYVRVIILSC